MLNVFSLPAPS